MSTISHTERGNTDLNIDFTAPRQILCHQRLQTIDLKTYKRMLSRCYVRMTSRKTSQTMRMNRWHRTGNEYEIHIITLAQIQLTLGSDPI